MKLPKIEGTVTNFGTLWQAQQPALALSAAGRKRTSNQQSWLHHRCGRSGCGDAEKQQRVGGKKQRAPPTSVVDRNTTNNQQ